MTLAGLYLLFLQFLPPSRAYHLIGDIEGYHYPLLNYAFKALKEGRLPLWDPSIYSGTSFVGNMQAQLFYPPTWLLLGGQWGRKGLSFLSIEIFTFAHLWVLLQGSYWWLRSGRRLPVGAALVGATVLSVTGYLLNDLQHTGAICGAAWVPFALWGVDRRRVWMIALASALTLLSGYPATWIAAVLAMGAYAVSSDWRQSWRVVAGVALSMGLAAVQVLPTLELAKLRPPEAVYGGDPGLQQLKLYFFPGKGYEPDLYLYHGAGFLLALGLFVWNRQVRGYLPVLALGVAGFVFFKNPGEIVGTVAQRVPALLDVMQHWNFHLVLTVAAGLLAGLAWGPLAGARPRLVLAVVPLLWFEQYWFGVRREPPFRDLGNVDRFFAGDARLGGESIIGMDPALYARLRAQPEYRVASEAGPHPTELRHYGLSTPRGFDPFVTVRYRKEVERFAPFQTNREFAMPVDNLAMFRHFAVRYFVSAKERPEFKALAAAPAFRLVQPTEGYYRVFEFLDAEPAYRYPGGTVAIEAWTPEVRRFQTTSATAGEFALLEQNLPGWTVTVDGAPAGLGVYSEAFQKVAVPAGSHRVEFRYYPAGLTNGLWVTALSGLLLGFAYRKRL